MHGTNDAARGDLSAQHGLTRRGFMWGGGAAVGAFALLLPAGCQVAKATRTAGGTREGNKLQFGDDARAVDDQQPASAEPRHVHPKRATCLALTADGSRVTSDDLGQLVVSKGNAAQPPFKKIHSSEDGKPIKAAYVCVAGNRVLTAGYDGNVNVHDLSQPELGNATPMFAGHRLDGKNREVWVAILTPDGKTALSATNDGQILLWDANEPGKPASKDYKHPAKTQGGPVGGLAFVPPNSNAPTHFLSTCYRDIHLWDIQDPTKPAFTFTHGNSFAVNAVAVKNDGRKFVSGGFDGTIRVWDLNVKDIKGLSKTAEKKIKGHKHWVWRVALSQDARLAASAGQDGAVRIWDITGDPIRQVGGDHNPGKGGSMGVVFGPNNTVIYTLDHLDKSVVLTQDTFEFPQGK